MKTTGSPFAREIARELLERETAGVTDMTAIGAAMQRACARVAENLRRSVGEDGYTALLGRALARTQSAQPVLKDMRLIESAGVHLDVAGGVEGHGAAAVGTALESLLAALADILIELIGADMARSLLGHDDSRQAPDEEGMQ